MSYTYPQVVSPPLSTGEKLTDAEAAWLACAVDSEGSISAIIRRKISGPFIVPRVVVYNTNPAYVARAYTLLARAAGGANTGLAHAGTNAPVLRAEVASGLRVLPVLREISPFLIVKRDRAEAIIAFIEARLIARKNRPRAGGNTPYGDELARLCEIFGMEVPK